MIWFDLIYLKKHLSAKNSNMYNNNYPNPKLILIFSILSQNNIQYTPSTVINSNNNMFNNNISKTLANNM